MVSTNVVDGVEVCSELAGSPLLLIPAVLVLTNPLWPTVAVLVGGSNCPDRPRSSRGPAGTARAASRAPPQPWPALVVMPPFRPAAPGVLVSQGSVAARPRVVVAYGGPMAGADEGALAPTIYDVARVAGVAPSTVSRTFSRPGRVSASTAARVRAVAEDLGFRAAVVDSAPCTVRTGILAMLVSDLTNPFYAEIIRGAQRAAEAAGYVILLADARESATIERHTLDRILRPPRGS